MSSVSSARLCAVVLVALGLPATLVAVDQKAVVIRLSEAVRPMQLQAASHRGGPGLEEFVAVAPAPDGSLLVAGNSWGPEPVPGTEGQRLGSDGWREIALLEGGGLEAFADRQMALRRKQQDPTNADLSHGRDVPLEEAHPMRSGFLLRYAGDLGSVRGGMRLGFGTASITAMALLPDGEVLIAGSGGPGLASLVEAADKQEAIEAPDYRDPAIFGDRFAHAVSRVVRQRKEDAWRAVIRARFGPRYYEGEKLDGDAYVARLSADLRTVRWITVFKGHRHVEQLAVLDNGRIGVDAQVVYRLEASNGTIQGPGLLLHRCDGFDPVSGLSFRYGLGLEGTGSHPPAASDHARIAGDDATGRERWVGYPWAGPLFRHHQLELPYGLTIRDVLFEPDGHVVLAMNAGGVDSVAQRHPFSLLHRADRALANEVTSAMNQLESGSDRKKKKHRGATGVSHLIRFHPQTGAYPVHSAWSTAGPGQQAIDQVIRLADGSLAVAGLAAGRLITTDGSTPPSPEDQHRFVAVLTGDMERQRLCTWIPAVEITDMAASGAGLVLVGRSQAAGPGFEPQGTAPVRGGGQSSHGGHYYDAWIGRIGPGGH